MSDETIGEYRVHETLESGHRGRLVRATHGSSGQKVLVRELGDDLNQDEERMAEAQRVAGVVGSIRDASILPVVRLLADDGATPLLVMEDLDGGRRLSDVVTGSEGLGLATSLKIFRQIVQGLDAASARDIRHRDLRPATVMVSGDLRRAALFDFGIGQQRRKSDVGGSTMELSTDLLNYAAPEKLGGRRTDLRSDLYAAGVILYEMLTGIVPQIGRFNLPSQLSSDVPPEVDPLVLKCLATKPRDRYAEPGEILRDLESLESRLNVGLVSELQGLSRSTSQLILGPEVGRRRRRNLFAGLAVVGLLGLAIVAATMWPGLSDRGPSGPVASEGAPAPPPDESVNAAGEVEAGAAEEPDVVDAVDGPGPEPSGSTPEPSSASMPPQPRDDASPAPSDDSPAPVAPPPPTSEATVADGAEPPPSEPVAPTEGQALEDLRVAEQKLEAGLLEAAEKDLGAWLDSYPDDPGVGRARLALGEALRQQGRSEAAMAAWIEVETRHDGTPEAVEAALRRAEILAIGEPDEKRQAVELFATIASGGSSSDAQAARALAGEARVRTEIGGRVTDPELGVSVPSELPALRRLASTHPDDPRSERAFGRLAEMYADLDRHALAAEAWEELGRRFPGNRQDAWWEAARLWERKLDDDERALAAYRRVPRNSDRYDDAAKKIARLERR